MKVLNFHNISEICVFYLNFTLKKYTKMICKNFGGNHSHDVWFEWKIFESEIVEGIFAWRITGSVGVE